VKALAVLSMHTSPLAQPGTGDGGGLNVYVRELATSMAHQGVRCEVFARRTSADDPAVVDVEPGIRVVHVDAGPPGLTKEQLPSVVDQFTEGVERHLAAHPVDAIHAHYWLSGVAGHQLKHRLDIPLAVTFHTLGRVKTELGDPEPEARVSAEEQVIGCSDAVVAAMCELQDLIARHGLQNRVRFVEPQPHHLLSTYYRAADVCLVPSRSESFGLVALEAAACGTPVVATDVGGLRNNVDHGVTGFLVGRRDPVEFAARVDDVLGDPLLALRLGEHAAERARSHTWGASAAGAVDVFGRLTARELVDCA
jgi:glycosyltransferase involved in cell wall biosynthesis